jgi:hypothetical protein
MWRSLFVAASNPQSYFDADNLRDLTRRIDDTPAWDSASSDADWAALFDRSSGSLRQQGDVLGLALRHASPMGGTLGAWMQGFCTPSRYEEPLILKALALFADDVGGGQARQGRSDAYRRLCGKFGLRVPHGSVALANQEIDDEMFAFPGLLAAMSRRADVFGGHLIGANLVLRKLGQFPVWRAMSRLYPDTEWARLDLSVPNSHWFEGGGLVAASESLASSPEGQAFWPPEDVAAGTKLARNLFAAWDERLRALVESYCDAEQAMAALLVRRSREASVYHQGFRLEGKTLDVWFQDASNDPLPLVRALARSRLVRAGQPQRSPLLTSLIAPGGAMFRIFTREEIGVIERWIVSLGDAREETPAASAAPFSQEGPLFPKRSGDLALGPIPTDLRDAYHMLQSDVLEPRTREFAAQYCDFWLEASEPSIDQTSRSLPPKWRAGELTQWLRKQHDTNAAKFDAAEDTVPPVENVIEDSLQLAPLTLLDGAWLQGFCDVGLASADYGAPLFNTYWDELGNGDYEINHPKIYRDLMEGMGITLHPTASREFAMDPRFADKSFRLPVFWLAIGRFPVKYRAEILGLNLAMELSGVGGSYRIARRALKAHGFPTTFVDLHNTIDNVATGHAAWAANAIDSFLTDLSQSVDITASWHRVRCGYEALAPIVETESALDFFCQRQAA